MVAQVAASTVAEIDRGRPFHLDFREQHWVPGFTFLVDVVAVETALFFGYLVRYALSSWWPINLTANVYAGLIIGVLVMPISCYLVGLHPGYGLGSVERLRRRLTVTIFVFGVLIAWDNIVQTGDWSRGVMLATFAFALVLTPLFETLGRGYLIRMGCWGMPILLAGTGEKGALLARILRDDPALGFVPIGFLSQNGTGITEVEDLPVLGDISQAGAFKNRVDTLIVTVPGITTNGLGSLTQDLPFPRIIMIPNLPEFPSLWVNTRDFGGVLALELRQNLLIPRNQLIKRISDYVLAIPLFLVSLPILAGAALCIQIASPGPVFYTQERIGMYGRRFRLIKLRTMRPDADQRLEEHLRKDPKARAEWARFVKLRNDPRLVPIFGALIRKISLDEVPQLWNILRGEMSLAGPRPFTNVDLPHYGADFLTLRQSVRPGITGLWQILARSDGDAMSKEVLDTYYIRNWSLWLDLYVLVRTPWAVLSMKGAC